MLGLREEQIARAGFHRHAGIRIGWDAPARFEPYGEDASGPWHGFQADRRQLATILQQAAVEAGASLRKPARATSLVMDGNRLNGVATGDGEMHLARLTIDATGRRAWPAHALGIAPDLRSPPLYATFGWTSQAGVVGCSEPELATRADGWHWAAPVGGGKSAWVVLRAGESGRRPPGCRRQLAYASADGGRTRNAVVGDAAVILDPASSTVSCAP